MKQLRGDLSLLVQKMARITRKAEVFTLNAVTEAVLPGDRSDVFLDLAENFQSLTDELTEIEIELKQVVSLSRPREAAAAEDRPLPISQDQ